VFLGDRIVFLLDQLVGHGARVLARHIIKTRVGAGHELNLDGCGFRHDRTSISFLVGRQTSREAGKVKKGLTPTVQRRSQHLADEALMHHVVERHRVIVAHAGGDAFLQFFERYRGDGRNIQLAGLVNR
jgi:hypothetical protein